jgi:hypothetical protein
LTNIKLKGINKSIYKKGRWKNHGLRHETSQSKKDDKESYQEEIVIRGFLLRLKRYFFLDKGGEFCYRFGLYNSFGISFIANKRVGFDEERR